MYPSIYSLERQSYQQRGRETADLPPAVLLPKWLPRLRLGQDGVVLASFIAPRIRHLYLLLGIYQALERLLNSGSQWGFQNQLAEPYCRVHWWEGHPLPLLSTVQVTWLSHFLPLAIHKVRNRLGDPCYTWHSRPKHLHTMLAHKQLWTMDFCPSNFQKHLVSVD